MSKYFFVCSKSFNEYIRDILNYQLHFCFPQINEVSFEDGGIKIAYEGELAEIKVRSFIEKIEAKFSKLNLRTSKKKLYDSKIDGLKNFPQQDKNLFVSLGEGLVQRFSSASDAHNILNKPIVEVGRGLNIYTGTWLIIHDMLDDLTKSYLTEKFKALELKVPSIISKEIIKKSGYFETGSQHLSFIAPISNDPDIYDELIKNNYSCFSGDIDMHESFKYFRSPTHALNPALCLHCYPLFEDMVFDKDETFAFTVKGSCLRNESGNLNNRERLNEFTMREGIFFGSYEKLSKIHQELIDFTIYLGALFGLDYSLETSNDIFFDENASQQLFSQMLSDNKIEFRVYCRSIDKMVSAASINKHLSHFSSRFNMKDETGEHINTMCIGFGFDRLVLAINDASGGNMDKLLDIIKANILRIKN